MRKMRNVLRLTHALGMSRRLVACALGHKACRDDRSVLDDDNIATDESFKAANNHTFNVRATGGYYFFTNTGVSTGLRLSHLTSSNVSYGSFVWTDRSSDNSITPTAQNQTIFRSSGGYFGPEASQETPDTHTTLFEYADGTILEFATRGQFTNDEGTQKIGNLFYGSKGWVWIDGDGRTWQSYFGPKNEKGPGREEGEKTSGSDPLVLTSEEGPHYRNFIDAIRANDPKLLNCDVTR